MINRNTMDSTQFPQNLEAFLVPFARYSPDLTLLGTKSNVKTRFILPGDQHNTNLHEVLINSNDSDNDNRIAFKSFKNDYKKPNGSVDAMNLRNGTSIMSHITSDNKYILMLHYSFGYNVYDIENDNWLLKENKQLSIHHMNARSVLINDEILAISEANMIYIYTISLSKKYDRLRDPYRIKEYEIPQTFDCNYDEHGMGVNNVMMDGNGHVCEFGLYLFGGYHRAFDESFHTINVDLFYKAADVDDKSINNNIYVNIEINSVNIEKYKGFKCKKGMRLSLFGYESIINSANEFILLIIGGKKMVDPEDTIDLFMDECEKLLSELPPFEKWILEYNTVKNTITCHKNVCNTVSSVNLLKFLQVEIEF